MRQVNSHEAKTQLSKLAEAVEAGERLVIARAGRPGAVLSPIARATRRRRLGQVPGEAQVLEGVDVLPEDLKVAFEGGRTRADG